MNTSQEPSVPSVPSVEYMEVVEVLHWATEAVEHETLKYEPPLRIEGYPIFVHPHGYAQETLKRIKLDLTGLVLLKASMEGRKP
jgi:hypothetical protein